VTFCHRRRNSVGSQRLHYRSKNACRNFTDPALASSCGCTADDAPVVVSLVASGRSEVTISGDRDAFEVAVRMKPIQCFDKVTNERLNEQKARSYSLQGLLKHLSWRRKISKLRFQECNGNGDSIRWGVLSADAANTARWIRNYPQPRGSSCYHAKTSMVSPAEEIHFNSSLIDLLWRPFSNHRTTGLVLRSGT
jgi:hypothetical protein